MPWVPGPLLRGHPRLSKSRKLLLALALVLPTFGIGSVSPVLAAGQFTFLAAGFTQELYGVDSGFMGGVAFASNGDPLVDDCSGGGGSLRRYDHATLLPPVHGTSTLHPQSRIPSAAGCGMTNHPNGAIYTNTFSGVVKLDATTGAQLGVAFGPGGNGLGIAPDPQTGNLVYVKSDGTIGSVNPGLTASGTFSTVTYGRHVDGIFFDPTGNFLFMADQSSSQLTIVRRDGSLAQNVAMGPVPDGIAFHSVGAQFVLTSNTNGTMTRFDFPGNDFTKTPTASDFATGGFRGDLTQVGADGCLYATQGGTRYDDAATDSNTSSLVRICPGFAPPPGLNQCTPTGNLLGNPGFEAPIASQAPAAGNWIVQQSANATVSQPSQPVHSGDASLEIHRTQPNDLGYVYQEISGFQPTNGWTFSAYFYKARGGAQQLEQISVGNFDVGVNSVVYINFLPVGGPVLNIGDRSVAAADPISPGQWHLISLLATANQIQMTLDAGAPVSLPYTPPLLAQASVTTVTLGDRYPGILSHFFFDDVSLVQECSGRVALGISFTASDQDWTVTAQVTPHDGMQVTGLATGLGRELGATISTPYVHVTSSRRPAGQIYFLLRDGDETDAQGRVYGHSKLVAGPNIVKRNDSPGGFELQATYLIVLDGPGVANPSHLRVQQRIILVDKISDADHGEVPCEPSETAPFGIHFSPLLCQRFRPALSYTFLPGAGDRLSVVGAVQRLHFRPDGKKIAASTLAHDCNIGETISPSGDKCFNNPSAITLLPFLPGIALYRNEDPLTNEAAQVAVDNRPSAGLGGGPGNFPGAQDNIHLSTRFLVTLPLPPPGCPECIHLHWRWASDIGGPELGSGKPLVGCCAKLWPTADPSNGQFTCVFLLSNGGASDESLKKGKIGPLCADSGTPLNEPVVWYSSTSAQAANTFFAWGGFVCPIANGRTC